MESQFYDLDFLHFICLQRLKKFFFGCCGYNPDGDRQASKHDPYPVIHVYNNYEVRTILVHQEHNVTELFTKNKIGFCA